MNLLRWWIDKWQKLVRTRCKSTFGKQINNWWWRRAITILLTGYNRIGFTNLRHRRSNGGHFGNDPNCKSQLKRSIGLTHHVHRGAKFYALFVGDVPVSIAAMMRRPHPKAKNVMGISRGVTIPDWQGLGLHFILLEKLGMAYRSIGERLRAYPAHPAVVRSFQRSPQWKQAKQAGTYSPRVAASSSVKAKNKCGSLGGRPNATFEYVGERLPDRKQARKFINGE